MSEKKNKGPRTLSTEEQKQLEENMKVLKYLKNQLRIKREQLKALEEPFDKELLRDSLQVQLLIKRTQVDQLQDQIDAIEMMLDL